MNPPRMVVILGIGIVLSLLGDATLYVVLPTHTAEAGIAVTQVGLMLSANRLIRIVLNGPGGLLIERLPRRRILIPSMLIGALATLLYTFGGFWLLLVGRLLWGVAWVGLWIGSSTMILDVVNDTNRGRFVGRFQMWMFIGVGVCSVLGGILTDALSYRLAVWVGVLTLLVGAGLWWFFLPETRPVVPHDFVGPLGRAPLPQTPSSKVVWSLPLITAMLILGLNWLVCIGVVSAIMPALLQDRLGEQVILLEVLIPISTLTGTLTAANMVVSLFSSPLVGWISDYTLNRWLLVVGALLVGMVSTAAIANGSGGVVVAATMSVAFTSSVLQTQSYTLVGDYAGANRQGRALGVLTTVADAGAAAGPLLAYALLPVAGLAGIFVVSALLMTALLPLVVWVARQEIVLGRRVYVEPSTAPK